MCLIVYTSAPEFYSIHFLETYARLHRRDFFYDGEIGYDWFKKVGRFEGLVVF
jgi:hypothetical protein